MSHIQNSLDDSSAFELSRFQTSTRKSVILTNVYVDLLIGVRQNNKLNQNRFLSCIPLPPTHHSIIFPLMDAAT